MGPSCAKVKMTSVSEKACLWCPERPEHCSSSGPAAQHTASHRLTLGYSSIAQHWSFHVRPFCIEQPCGGVLMFSWMVCCVWESRQAGTFGEAFPEVSGEVAQVSVGWAVPGRGPWLWMGWVGSLGLLTCEGSVTWAALCWLHHSQFQRADREKSISQTNDS